ncbi:MAG: alpha/beta fold hydrolase, partial [Pseudomonadota bacterium]
MHTISETFEFPNARGDMLAGSYDRPAHGGVRAIALFAHCFTCTMRSRAAVRIARALAADGIGVLRFDFTGLGKSEGEFAETGFAVNVDDLIAAARALARDKAPPALLIGHSLGGAAVLAAASHIDSVKAVVTLGAPFETDHVLGHLGETLKVIEEEGAAQVDIGGRPFTVSKSFLDATRGHDQRTRVRDLRKALLVMHSPTDQIVGIENAADIFTAARHPKSFISLDDADHLLMRAADTDYAAGVITSWVQRYVDLPDADVATEEGEVRVEPAGGRFTQAMEAGTHRILADEPERIGGSDLGPTPYDLLLGALGTCTNMTVRMIANKEKIPLRSVSTRLTHNRRYDEDCEGCMDAPRRQEPIVRQVTFTG